MKHEPGFGGTLLLGSHQRRNQHPKCLPLLVRPRRSIPRLCTSKSWRKCPRYAVIGAPPEEMRGLQGLQVEPHHHSEIGIEAMICFRFADLSDPRADFGLRQDSEAEMLIQWAIPWDVPEGCERER